MTHRVFISLGSNINPAANLRTCLSLLREKCDVQAVSPIYETAPVGYTAQENFLNAAVLVHTELSPAQFRAAVIVPIERALQRVRDPYNKNAPRTIDLDIALWENEAFDFGEKPWHVPDKDIVRFIHVARPLADLAPDTVHPEDGRTLAQIAAELPAGGLYLRDDLARAEQGGTMPVKVLLDTDIGSDIDDAVCLAYLLAQPDCELLGITTVTGEGTRRAMMCSALCRVAGQDVPIYPGVEEPFLIAQRQPQAPQAGALDGWSHDTTFPQGEAIAFLRRTIHAHPGAITLLTIGPLTNVALLFALHPEIPALLKELVIMGGYYANRHPGVPPLEWNIILDPHAAARVFRSPVNIRAVGTEITRQVTMPAEEVRRRFQPDLLRPVLDFAEVWFRGQAELTFHDPLAAATIFDDTICTFEHGTADVELTSERLLGFTHWYPGDRTAPHQVAASVDAGRFYAHFFGMFE